MEKSRENFEPNSWVDSGVLPEYLYIDFEELWSLKPEEKEKFRCFGRECTFPRYHRSFGKDYVFSGKTHRGHPILDMLIDLKEFFETEYGEFQQVLVNWYENGLDYISKHKDDEKQIVRDSPIVSISFGQERKFRIRDSHEKILKDINMTGNSFLVMGGEFQTHFYHEVPKVCGNKGESMGRRINITLRKFTI